MEPNLCCGFRSLICTLLRGSQRSQLDTNQYYPVTEEGNHESSGVLANMEHNHNRKHSFAISACSQCICTNSLWGLVLLTNKPKTNSIKMKIYWFNYYTQLCLLTRRVRFFGGNKARVCLSDRCRKTWMNVISFHVSSSTSYAILTIFPCILLAFIRIYSQFVRSVFQF